MKYHKLGNTGYEVSAIGYGGVVSSQHFDEAVIPGDGQKMSDEAVAFAVDHGINYFDVAPGYGDAQQLLGNSLKPCRDKIYLACKTNQRRRAEAERDMEESLRLLHTDHFDVYQIHGLVTMEDMETVFAPGGAMELLVDMKKQGIAFKLGLTAHSEPVALEAMKRFDFDTIMFPLNWHMHMAHGMGERVRRKAKEKNMGLLGIKSMIERAWGEENRYTSKYPKSWCKPFDPEKEPEILLAAIKYAVSLGEDVLVPPGNFQHLQFAVNHLEEIWDQPLTAEERELLEKSLPAVLEFPFYDPECYEGSSVTE